MSTQRRPIDEMLTELIESFGTLDAGSIGTGARIALAPSSIELDLPVEASVEHQGGKWIVLADSPRSRTQTDFDIPASRISATISVEPTS